MGHRLIHTALPYLIRNILLLVLVFCLIMQESAGAALFGSFGIKDEQELGRKFIILVRSKMSLIEDPEVVGYLQSLVDRLQKVMPPQPFPFKTNMLLHPTMNAFAVPGGQVFVHTGLVMQLEHESELAGVLAHELTHVSQRHIARRIETAQTITLASLAGVLASVFMGGGAGTGAMMAGSMAAGQAALLKYSRMDESEADDIGLQYLIKAGFPPSGMQGAFEKIRRQQWSSGMEIPEYLSTHPDVGNRINEIHARIQGLPASVRNKSENDRRFQRVKTLIWARYGEPEAASRLFAQTTSGNCLALMGQGILAERRKQVKKAQTSFAQAMSCAPNDSLVWREAGHFAYSIGDPEAERLLARALQLDPDDLMAQFYYARLLSAAGRRSLAHTYYKQLLRRLPEDADVHYYYGRSLGEGGEAFQGFLHLAYSALYRNDQRQLEKWLKQAQALAKSPQDEADLKRFVSLYEERKNLLKK